MRKFIISLLIVLIIGLHGIAAAQEPGDGIIYGQVINDTQDGGNVAGLEVCLIPYIEGEMQAIITATTDEEGQFQFDNLTKEYQYLISVTYMDVDYYYPVVFPADDNEAHMQVAVCDSTTNDQAIKVLLAHKIIDFEGDNASVTEMYILLNSGDQTYIGSEESVIDGKKGVLVFTLPQGATDIKTPEELADDFLVLSESKVGYAVPFPPGESQIVFTYSLSMPKGNELNLSFVLDYPTEYLDVMVKSDNMEVATGQLAPADPIETGTGERYIHFAGENFPRDDTIEIRLVRQSNNISLIILVPVIILAIVVIAVITYFMKRKKVKTQRLQIGNDSEVK